MSKQRERMPTSELFARKMYIRMKKRNAQWRNKVHVDRDGDCQDLLTIDMTYLRGLIVFFKERGYNTTPLEEIFMSRIDKKKTKNGH